MQLSAIIQVMGLLPKIYEVDRQIVAFALAYFSPSVTEMVARHAISGGPIRREERK